MLCAHHPVKRAVYAYEEKDKKKETETARTSGLNYQNKHKTNFMTSLLELLH